MVLSLCCIPHTLPPRRHSYVRRNAVLAISALCKLPKGDLLVPDADELIERFLGQEQDVSAKRNALMLLTQHSQVRCGRSGRGGAAAVKCVWL
jgi:coatomer subunit beta